MVSTISEKISMEKSFKNGFKQYLKKESFSFAIVIAIYVVTGGYS